MSNLEVPDDIAQTLETALAYWLDMMTQGARVYVGAEEALPVVQRRTEIALDWIEAHRAKEKMSNLYFTHLIGRNRTGSEPGGTLIHAVPGNEGGASVFGKALCGAQPGRRSNGWSEYTSTVPTCPKCIKKMEKAKAKA